MRYRRTALIVAAFIVAASACTSSPPETSEAPTSAAPTTTAATSTTEEVTPPEPLPVDPDVRMGRLDNGLTYYLRHNDSPGGRAELRLLVDAGSVQEEDDQAGIAHFLEHMMFNGTGDFPRNELTAALESFGPQFGPDINAFTSFDETVYELSLATEDEELIDLGIAVLRGWADAATLTEQDVVEERGVVLDEWRLRAQGPGGRISEAFQELVLDGTVYEGRAPIGNADSIQATTSPVLRRFYEDWYRPERMAVVAVGDFDLDRMEERIVDAFGSLEGSDTAQPGPTATYTPPDKAAVAGITDPEVAAGSVSVLWPRPATPVAAVADFESFVARSMGMGILANRLNDDALRGESPLLGAGELIFDLTRTVHLSGLSADATPQEVEAALGAVLTEVERIKQHGVNDQEFERVMTTFRTGSELRRDQAESRQDVAYAAQIGNHHLAGGDLMSPEQRYEVETAVLSTITKPRVETALTTIFDVAPIILAYGPDDADATVPDEARILEIIDDVAFTPVEARPASNTGVDSFMAKPAPVRVADSETDRSLSYFYTTLTFDNGATVFLMPSTIAEGSLYVGAESFGGTSQIAVEDLPEAFLITDIIARSGVGPADAPTMDRLLADRAVSVGPWISETREGLSGGSAAEDAEILFQLIHLYMTAPRIDDVAVAAVLDEMEAVNASRDDIGSILFSEALDQGYYGDDPRYFTLPTDEQLAEFDVEIAEAVYRERFANAGDFAFAFVGDFDVATMTDLAASYIGTLPGTPTREGFIDHQPLPPREIQITTVEAGTDPQGLVGMYFTNEFDPVLEDRVTGRVLELIVNARLRDRIREELSATYSPSAGIDLQRDPDPFAESNVRVTGDPTDLTRISDEVMADLVDLQTNGPTQEQFATAVEQLRTELDLINNVTLADALLTSYLYPDQPVSELVERYDLVDQVTPEDVRRLALIAFNPDQRIEARLLPRP